MKKKLSIHALSTTLALCTLVCGNAISKSVSISNNSPHEVFGAIYQTNTSYGLRIGDVVPLMPRKETDIPLPNINVFKNRMLYVDLCKETLRPKLDFTAPTSFFTTPPANLNFGKPTKLVYMESVRGPEIIPADSEEAEQTREELRKEIAEQSPHYGKVSTVTNTTTELCPEETAYLKNRQKVTLAAMEKITQKSVNVAHAPRIMLCVSGGGYRAMLATLGSLCGLEEIGVLATTEYITSVSGGSWAVIPWMLSQKSPTEYSAFVAQHIAEQTEEKLIKNSISDFNTFRHIKGLFGNSTGLTDLYSIVLSKRLLHPLKQKHLSLCFSQMGQKIKASHYPYPLCSAVVSYKRNLKNKYDWVNMSPWNIELARSGHSIPTWSFMRHFNNGTSIDFTPEPWLGYLLGIWGSAFSVSLQEILLHTHNASKEFASLIPQRWLKSKIMRTLFGNKQCTALIPNFTYGIQDAPHNSKNNVHLIDAGHYCNLPVIPLLHPQRKPELIIMIHNGITDKDNEFTLRKTLKILHRKYPKLTLDITEAIEKPVMYWPSTDVNTPSIIHIGIHKNESFNAAYNPRTVPETSTFNFWYTTDQATRLIELMRKTIIDHRELFTTAIDNAIEKKKSEVGAIAWLTSNVKAMIG